jgi:hypothetical protein
MYSHGFCIGLYDKLWIWMCKSRSGFKVRFGFCVYTDQRHALRLPLFLLQIYFHNVVAILQASSHAQGSLFISSILVYTETLSVCATECRWYENDIKWYLSKCWQEATKVLHKKNPSQCHLVHRKSGRSSTWTGFSPNISVYRARCILKAGFLSTTKVNTCVSMAIIR